MEDSQSTECALLSVGTGKLVPAFAFSYPLNLTFIIAEGGSGSSFSALVSWLSHPTAPGTAQRPVPVVPLAQLLPSDADPALCHTLTPPTALTLPGLSRALVCNDPGLANGEVYAFQMTTFADYEAPGRTTTSGGASATPSRKRRARPPAPIPAPRGPSPGSIISSRRVRVRCWSASGLVSTPTRPHIPGPIRPRTRSSSLRAPRARRSPLSIPGGRTTRHR